MAGDDAGKQPEVVLDDRFGNRLRGYVDHLQPRLTQQQQQEQGAFLHRLHDGAARRGGALDADRGDHDNRFVLQILLYRVPRVAHRQLQVVEGPIAVVFAQLTQGSVRCL